MPVDPSIGLQIGQGVTPIQNPLQTLGAYQGLINAQAQNKLTAASTASTLQQTAQSGGNALAQTFAEFAALPDEMRTPNVLKQAVIYNGKIGGASPDQVQAALAHIDNAGQFGGVDNLARMAMLHHMGGTEQAAQVYGQPGSQSNGQQVQPGVVASPMSVAGQGRQMFNPSGPAVQQYLSPEAAAGRVIVGVDPKGAPQYGPLGTVTPGGLPRQPGGSSFGNGGRFPSGLLNPNAPPGVPNNGVVTTGIGPAAESALATTGASSAKAFQDITDQGLTARSQDSMLANMQGDAAQFATGPGQQPYKHFQAALQGWAPRLAATFGINSEKIAANESFDKLAAQIAAAQGSGTDSRLALTQAANPNSSMTPAGVDMILRQLRGNAAYLTTRAKLAASYPDKADRSGFEAKVGDNLDPRVFQYQMMTPAQKGTFLATMKDAGVFKKKYGWAEAQGLIGGQNAGQ